ncbi:MAG: hypothetical protein AAB573_03175 [Patescibacteria group bacterium]
MSRTDEKREHAARAHLEGARLEAFAQKALVIPHEAVSSVPIIEKQFATRRDVIVVKPEVKKEVKLLRSNELPRGTKISREDFRAMQNKEKGQDLAFNWIEQIYWDVLKVATFLPRKAVEGFWLALKDGVWPATKWFAGGLGLDIMALPLIGNLLRWVGARLSDVSTLWKKIPELIRATAYYAVLFPGLVAALFIPVLNGPMIFGLALAVRNGEIPTVMMAINDMMGWIRWLIRVKNVADGALVWPIERRVRGLVKT